ncbi:hypothetical protein P1J78_07860 [Psychromarinibacter sp. C21-152]|uniref:VanZ like family protein n=1 Tax=Psychromarinibacter sediminicola TaxID=3033385 RepID=A0AAE3T9L2_9RHOB|nr:hypothetical protein [Psychromarinibacter sediminicola]MDF0600640.1 hypothetical protein [Psychromarinibacter sediminicola]
MFGSRIIELAKSFLISIAIYPVVLVGVWGLVALGTVAADMHMPADTMPLIYGLVFAVLTVALIDLLGVASVVLALVASANLIEYAQLLVPGRSPSAVDFVASLVGVVVAATLVWVARALVERHAAPDH